MVFGDPRAPAIPSKDALRQARAEAINEDLNIKKGSNLWESLAELKTDPEMKKFIKDVGYDKAHVSYWSQDQIWIHNKIQSVSGTSVSIDASSGVSKRTGTGIESSATFLFVIVCHINDLIVPLGQLLTEKQDANFITWWLNSWRAAGGFGIFYYHIL